MTNKRISVDPKVCHGKPVIRNTRVLVTNILGSLAAGESVEQVLQDYPSITREDIQASLEFGSRLSQFEAYPYDQAI